MAHRSIPHPLRRLLFVLSLSLIGLASLGLSRAAVIAGSAAVAQTIIPSGYVYVNDNTAGTNTVAAFYRASTGDLTPISGSPFQIGCCGTGASMGSQGALELSDNGQFLLAVNAGGNSIAVLRIGSSGHLGPVAGSPFPSGGLQPLSLAVHGSLVYVANAGDGGANYTGFRQGADGSLTPITGSTVAVPNGAGLSDVLFSADGTHLVGTRVNTSTIDSFAVGGNGTLTAAKGSPFAAEGQGPFGSEFQPTGGAQLFVSNAHDGAGKGTVSSFSVASDGTFTSAKGSPFADQQTAPCWVDISPDGKYLFAVNTMSDNVSSYTIASDGTLTLAGSTPLSGGPKLGATEVDLDPTGHFLYVLDGKTNHLNAFSVSGSTLTELASSPVALPGDATPFGLEVR